MTQRISKVWLATALVLLVASIGLDSGPFLVVNLLKELMGMMPLIIIVALFSGWLAYMSLGDRFRESFDRRPARAMILASLFGAVTPVCGIASAPMVAAMLRQGVPVSAAMAFLVASPVTDPGLVVLTSGLLGWPFALGKLMIAAVLGMVAGLVTAGLVGGSPQKAWTRNGLGTSDCEQSNPPRQRFITEARATFLLVLRWITFALTLEEVIGIVTGDAAYSLLASMDNLWAVPLAVLIGGPLYIEGYAALPLLRGMIDMGLTPGAAMAFLVSGAAISLYSATAVWHLVRPALFGVYLTVSILGSLLAGWITDAVILIG